MFRTGNNTINKFEVIFPIYINFLNKITRAKERKTEEKEKNNPDLRFKVMIHIYGIRCTKYFLFFI